jgi:hypothetical protein
MSCGRMIRLLAHSPFPPLSLEQVVSLLVSLPVCRWSSLLTGEKGRGWERSQIILYDRDKAWPFIIPSILSQVHLKQRAG